MRAQSRIASSKLPEPRLVRSKPSVGSMHGWSKGMATVATRGRTRLRWRRYPRTWGMSVEGSGADWLEEFKPSIYHEKTVICSPHKIFGPQNNDLVLQLQKLKIEKVILAGMSANLCVESHLRELLERGFDVVVAADATAAAKVPGLDGMAAALTNYVMLSSDVWTTSQAIEKMNAASG